MILGARNMTFSVFARAVVANSEIKQARRFMLVIDGTSRSDGDGEGACNSSSRDHRNGSEEDRECTLLQSCISDGELVELVALNVFA